MNLILRNRNEISKRHYVRKADPNQKYWFDFAAGKLLKYQQKYGEKFALILYGDNNIESDYYIIPFPVVAHIFVKEFFVKEKNTRSSRWIGNIERNKLRITHFPDKIDIGCYRNVPIEEINNKIQEVTFEGQTRDTIINARINQSVFRQRVLENFESACALSGIKEQDLLVASHVIPWSVRTDTRLDPGNGILLFSVYDALFDKGYISFNDDFQVITTPIMKSFSQELQYLLNSIEKQKMRMPVNKEINKEYLKWHRENKLQKF